MHITWLEIKRFLKDNKWLIIVGTIVFAIIMGVGLTLLESTNEAANEENQDSVVEPNEQLESNPAYFQFYVEHVDGDQFTNVSLLREYYDSEAVREETLQNTGTDLTSIEEQFEEENEINDPEEEFSVVNVDRNDNSNLMTVSINSGNEEENLELSDYYYNHLMNDQVSFLEDKNIYTFVEPQLDENLEEEENAQESAANNQTENSQSLILPAIRNALLGLIVGGVLMIGLALLKAIFGKKLNYSFAYEVGEEDDFILYDSSLDNESNVGQFVGVPFGDKKLMLAENSLNDEKQSLLAMKKGVSFNDNNLDGTTLIEMNSLTDVEIKNDFSEIIIVISPYSTTRKWYRTQRKFLELVDKPVKIIQLNN